MRISLSLCGRSFAILRPTVYAVQRQLQRRDAERRVAVAWEVGRSRAAAPTVESERKIEKRIRSWVVGRVLDDGGRFAYAYIVC